MDNPHRSSVAELVFKLGMTAADLDQPRRRPCSGPMERARPLAEKKLRRAKRKQRSNR